MAEAEFTEDDVRNTRQFQFSRDNYIEHEDFTERQKVLPFKIGGEGSF